MTVLAILPILSLAAAFAAWGVATNIHHWRKPQ